MAKNKAYVQAERKIEEALKNKTTVLDLGHSYLHIINTEIDESERLNEIPNSLFSLTNLQELNLVGHRLEEISPNISNLKNLHTLYLSYNELQSFPEELCDLYSLKRLYLTYNKIGDGLPIGLSKLSNLEVLYFHGNNLAYIPEQLFELKNLIELDYGGNSLTEIPSSFCHLTKLEKLKIKNNNLISLPSNFGALRNLQVLDVRGNHLSILPHSFAQLCQLETLDLSNNQLEKLPSNFGDLEHLENLNLDNNALSSLPPSIISLTKLKQLDLNSNKLEELPPEFHLFNNLQQLDLGDNNFERLPSDLQLPLSLEYLNLNDNQIEQFSIQLNGLDNLQELFLNNNHLSKFHIVTSELSNLRTLDLSNNKLTKLELNFEHFISLERLYTRNNKLQNLSVGVGKLTNLQRLDLSNNYFKTLTPSLGSLENLRQLYLSNNPLNTEVLAAYSASIEDLKAYLRTQDKDMLAPSNEVRVVIVGEGEVGKTCLMDSLANKQFQTNKTTHGIEISNFTFHDIDSDITINGWDFGGQDVYRPTHQIFFSSPAIYLIVWKPRQGISQGFVVEWIELIKHRVPNAKILIVSTHSRERRSNIPKHSLLARFPDNIMGFYEIDNKPDEYNQRQGIEELKKAIIATARSIPEVKQMTPQSWLKVRRELKKTNRAYMSFDDIKAFCKEYDMDEKSTQHFLNIQNNLGHLTYYPKDIVLQDIIILRPDWLTGALSHILNDDLTKKSGGLISQNRLAMLWASAGYEKQLHDVFIQLMSHFELSYEVPMDSEMPIYLVAQLVGEIYDEDKFVAAWEDYKPQNYEQRRQICVIKDKETSKEAFATGILYRLLVRFHRYSLGRDNYEKSVHWQHGIVLDAGYNGRALVERQDNHIFVTVRAAYPENFLSVITDTIKHMIERSWDGLSCEITVPCIHKPCQGLLLISQLIDSKQKGRTEHNCPTCNNDNNIDFLLRGAPQTSSILELDNSLDAYKATYGISEYDVLMQRLNNMYQTMNENQYELMRHVDLITKIGVTNNKAIEATYQQIHLSEQHVIENVVSRTDEIYGKLLNSLSDNAKDAPRMITLVPAYEIDVDNWQKELFILNLYCEYSRLPVSFIEEQITGKYSEKGVYKIELERNRVQRSAGALDSILRTVQLVLPITVASFQLTTDWTKLKEALTLGMAVINGLIGLRQMKKSKTDEIPPTLQIRNTRHSLEELHEILLEVDPDKNFGGLIRLTDKQGKYHWVHPYFLKAFTENQ